MIQCLNSHLHTGISPVIDLNAVSQVSQYIPQGLVGVAMTQDRAMVTAVSGTRILTRRPREEGF